MPKYSRLYFRAKFEGGRSYFIRLHSNLSPDEYRICDVNIDLLTPQPRTYVEVLDRMILIQAFGGNPARKVKGSISFWMQKDEQYGWWFTKLTLSHDGAPRARLEVWRQKNSNSGTGDPDKAISNLLLDHTEDEKTGYISSF